MSNKLTQALLTGLKVLGHIALSAAITAVFVYLLNDKSLVMFYPLINIIEATVFKYFSIDPSAMQTPPNQTTSAPSA